MMPSDEAPRERAPLKPAPDVQKFLISASCHLTGRLDTPNLLIADAMPGLGNRATHQRLRSAENARTVFTLVFRTNPADQGGFIIPQYDWVAEQVCGYLSLFYGKRFDSHGAIENSGLFGLPDLRALDLFCDPRLPQNGNVPRVDFGHPLELERFDAMLPLLFSAPGGDPRLVPFRTALKFYQQALWAAEHDMEIAYLHLISVGEILTGSLELDETSLVDARTRALLARIEAEMPDGAKTARIVRSKLRGIKRRFVLGLESLLDPAFFEQSQAGYSFARLEAKAIAKRLSAAYDLRSRYVHTGQSFGIVVGPRGMDREEVQPGKPMHDDKEFAKALACAPTYIGLERILRYCLLRYLETVGLHLGVLQVPPEAEALSPPATAI
jgi:hypothetical protein